METTDDSNNKQNKFNILELYSGIGGFHYAIKKYFGDFEEYLKDVSIIGVDINTTANNIYRHNFEEHCQEYESVLLERNIQSFSVEELDCMELELLTMSPPCQPFSRLGLKRDLDDNRCDSFQHLMRTLPKLKNKPRFIMLENVKGFETSAAHGLLLETLMNCHYKFEQFLLTPRQFGIPNTRLRYYLLAQLSSSHQKETTNSTFPIHDRIPILDDSSQGLFSDRENNLKFVESLENERPTISHYLDPNATESSSSSLSDKLLLRYHMLLDIVEPDSRTSNCFTKGYTHRIEGTGSVLKTATNVSVDDVYRELESLKTPTENPDGDCRPHNDESILKLLRTLGMRFFTPREIANLMCFPPEFEFPSNVNVKQQYRVLGNSVNVHVCYYLLKLLLGPMKS